MGKCSSGQVVVSTKGQWSVKQKALPFLQHIGGTRKVCPFLVQVVFAPFSLSITRLQLLELANSRVQKKPSRVKTQPQLSAIAYQRGVHAI